MININQKSVPNRDLVKDPGSEAAALQRRSEEEEEEEEEEKVDRS